MGEKEVNLPRLPTCHLPSVHISTLGTQQLQKAKKLSDLPITAIAGHTQQKLDRFSAVFVLNWRYFELLRRGVTHFFFQAEDGIRDYKVTGVQTCALPI